MLDRNSSVSGLGPEPMQAWGQLRILLLGFGLRVYGRGSNCVRLISSPYLDCSMPTWPHVVWLSIDTCHRCGCVISRFHDPTDCGSKHPKTTVALITRENGVALRILLAECNAET